MGPFFEHPKQALQWAQSPDSVFLNVKFSHKMDAPATLDVVVDQVEFTNRTLRLRVRLLTWPRTTS